MIIYNEPVIRPPAEADALILQATIGCSHNRCAFCVTYRQKAFALKPEESLFREIEWASRHITDVRKVFLGDGDALAMSSSRLLRILEKLYQSFPLLKKVGIYASPGNFRNKSVSDLEKLKAAGLSILYVGFESGDDEVLRRIDKGFSHAQMVELCAKPQAAGLKMSATIVLGLGGPRLSTRHATESARLIDDIRPRYASALTLMLPPRTPSYKEAFGDPLWRPMTPTELLQELRTFVQSVTASGVIFRSNHASNYLALSGTFQKSRQLMLDQIDAALADESQLRPEFLRGL